MGIKQILIWRAKHVPLPHFIILLSIVIGGMAGLAAVSLKILVGAMESLLTHSFTADHENYLYLALPLFGILLTVIFLRRFIKEKIGHGISRVLYAISRKKGDINAHNSYSSIIASTLTVGLGGSVGMEAPIVYTGSSIGSNIGKFFRLSFKLKVLLIGCGAAAAVSGIFKAPIAGVVFVLEILMLDLTTASIVPLLISSVSASVVAHLLLGEQIIFYSAIKDPFVFRNLLFYMPLGIFAGLISYYFMRMNMFVEGQIKRVQNIYGRVVVGGLMIGILIFVFPPLYGEGYYAIKSLLSGNPQEVLNNSFFYNASHNNLWIFVLYLLLILFFKVFATALTTGSGGIGGVFAPTLFIGAFAGFTFSRVLNVFLPFNISEKNFALVGMAGVMSGVMHAPLTAIFLIAEITGGYGLFLPLMVTASIAYMTSRYFNPHSIYTIKLAKRGELITHNKDKAVLTLINLKEVIETNLQTIHPNDSLGDITQVIRNSNRNIFPVVDEENQLLGLINLDDIRGIMFNHELYETIRVKDIMSQPKETVSTTDSMELVMDKFNQSGLWNIPVLEEDRYVGFISRSTVFAAYRKLMVEFSED